MYYSSIGLLSIIVIFINNYYVLTGRESSARPLVEKRYRSFLYSVIFFCVADVMWGVLYDLRIVPLVYSDTVLFFATMVLSVLLWTRFVVSYLNRDNFFSTVLTYAGWLIFCGELLCLVINVFVPILFRFDFSSGEYYPAFGRYATLTVQVVLFFATAIYAFYVTCNSEGKSKFHHKAAGVSGLTMTVFIILQMKYPLLPLYAVGCLIGTCIVHTFIVQDEKRDFYRELGSARHIANTDQLTGVKNAHAFSEAKMHVDQKIKNGSLSSEFGVIFFDLNGLKTINDTLGHEAGDRYIRNSCNYICRQFKHSPVYRIGGDEFVILLEGDDFENRDILLAAFEKKMEQNKSEGLVVVSSGMSVYKPGHDRSFDDIFERADSQMYERKRILKQE